MRTKGIGPNNLGMDKRNLASPVKQSKGKKKETSSADATVAASAQKSSTDDRTSKISSRGTGTVQEFLDHGPVPFIKRGVKAIMGDD